MITSFIYWVFQACSILQILHFWRNVFKTQWRAGKLCRGWKKHMKKHTKYWCGRQTSKNLRREIFLRTQSCANNWWTPPPSLPPSPATLRAPLFVGMFSSHWSYQSMLKLQRQFGNFRGHAKPWWGCPQWQVVTVNRYSLRTLKNDPLPFIGASGLTGSTCDSWFSP